VLVTEGGKGGGNQTKRERLKTQKRIGLSGQGNGFNARGYGSRERDEGGTARRQAYNAASRRELKVVRRRRGSYSEGFWQDGGKGVLKAKPRLVELLGAREGWSRV